MKDPVYNTIGKTYNSHRSADPYISSRLLALLGPMTDKRYLDIGCGTGNYLSEFGKSGYSFIGVDPSPLMLETAAIRCSTDTLIKSSAEKLPFEDESYDGAVAVLTLHHWTDQQKGLSEISRVLKQNSKLVIFSFTAAQMHGYWLMHYFPNIIKTSALLVPDEQGMRVMLNNADFRYVITEKYFVQPDLQDHFLYSNKFNPGLYLDPEIRKGISAFSLSTNHDEIEAGLAFLEKDINTGEINNIIQSYANDLGDYLFYIAEK